MPSHPCTPLPAQLLEKEGVRKYDPQGEPFDPNLHNAMFRVPNSGVKSGHVAHVIKVCVCGGGGRERRARGMVA